MGNNITGGTNEGGWWWVTGGLNIGV